MARARPKFTEELCKQFEDAANPHYWLLSSDPLHAQAVELHNRRRRGTLTLTGADGVPIASWDETNKATFLLCVRLRARERDKILPGLRASTLGE
jgi:hypothetical protein